MFQHFKMIVMMLVIIKKSMLLFRERVLFAYLKDFVDNSFFLHPHEHRQCIKITIHRLHEKRAEEKFSRNAEM